MNVLCKWMLGIARDSDGVKSHNIRKPYTDWCRDKLWIHRSSPIPRRCDRNSAKTSERNNVRDVIQKHDNIKINTAFNGEFVSGDKCANKSVNTKNYELFCSSNLKEWHELRVIEPILTSLEEFQERDSGWTLSRILNLTVNVNKSNPLDARCHIQLPREI